MAIYIDNLVELKNKQFNIQCSDFYGLSEHWNSSLYKIGKSKKGFIPNKGDIFLIQPIKGLYFYGKVLEIYNEEKSNDGYFAACVIFNSKTTKITIDNFDENYKNLIGVTKKLLLINSLFFQNGKIVVVGNTKIDNNIKFGFIESIGCRKVDDTIIDVKNIIKDDELLYKYPSDYKSVCKYADYNGNDLDYVPDFYGESLSYITEYGLLVLFYKEFYINNELFNYIDFDFNIEKLFAVKKINKNKEILPFKYEKMSDKKHCITLDVIEYTHLFKDYSIIGNGYDIEKIFMYFLNEEKLDSKNITTDSESQNFVIYCENKKYLLDVILKFKRYMENIDNLSNAIKKIVFEN
jgi:hypothetical protein